MKPKVGWFFETINKTDQNKQNNKYLARLIRKKEREDTNYLYKKGEVL